MINLSDGTIDEDTETKDVDVEEDSFDLDESLPTRYSITSYGADYPVDSLITRLESGAIYVPPFQRGYVWKIKQASRFIESLLLGLPVPGIFLAREQIGSKLIVIDGQQRLKTLQFFYQGVFQPSRREFALALNSPGVDNPFHGLTYQTMDENDKIRLSDSIVHATIIHQDEPADGQSSIYSIFERLNTGGVHLEPQEIRASIFYGPFSDLLSTMNGHNSWRILFGPTHSRMRDQELILRFLALYFARERYERPMKDFLNRYMDRNRDLSQAPDNLTELFENSMDVINQHIGPSAFKPKRAVNAAVFDAVSIGVAERVNAGPILHPEDLKVQHAALMADEGFQVATTRATADTDRVKSRIALGVEAFSRVR